MGHTKSKRCSEAGVPSNLGKHNNVPPAEVRCFHCVESGVSVDSRKCRHHASEWVGVLRIVTQGL